MRIKHWQGYGFINAENLGESEMQNVIYRGNYIHGKVRVIRIKVTGEHEYGLDRSEDTYDCVNWLLHKFKNYKDIKEEDVILVEFKEGDDWREGFYIFYVRTE